jgi:hypothetical protein
MRKKISRLWLEMTIATQSRLRSAHEGKGRELVEDEITGFYGKVPQKISEPLLVIASVNRGRKDQTSTIT